MEVGPELGQLIPELAGPANASTLSPELARARLFAGLLELLGRLGDGRPVLLALEDLQWADRSTLDVVRFLVRALADERLLIVLTVRGPLGALPPGAREAWTDLGRGRRSPRRCAAPARRDCGRSRRRSRPSPAAGGSSCPTLLPRPPAEGALRAEAGLTWRELEILRLLAAGETN